MYKDLYFFPTSRFYFSMFLFSPKLVTMFWVYTMLHNPKTRGPLQYYSSAKHLKSLVCEKYYQGQLLCVPKVLNFDCKFI